MNLIVTGSVQSGKTTYCYQYSRQLEEQSMRLGGILCPAIFDNEKKIGCDVYDHLSGKSRVFTRLSSLADFNGKPVGRYLINDEGLTFAEQAIKKALNSRCDYIFLDEIGPLEMAGKGIIDVAKSVYQSAPNTISVVRRELLVPFMSFLKKISFADRYIVNID